MDQWVVLILNESDPPERGGRREARGRREGERREGRRIEG